MRKIEKNARYSIATEHAETIDDLVSRLLPLLDRLLSLVELFYDPDEEFALKSGSLVMKLRRPTSEEQAEYKLVVDNGQAT
jgi:hypothetical protein